MTKDLELVRRKPNDDLVRAVEAMLVDAKNGEIKGVVYSVLYKDGGTGHGWVIPQKKKWKASALLGEFFMAVTELSNVVDGVNSESIRDG